MNNLLGRIAEVFVKERFDNLKRFLDIKSPVLLIHGKADELIPFAHSVALFGKDILFGEAENFYKMPASRRAN